MPSRAEKERMAKFGLQKCSMATMDVFRQSTRRITSEATMSSPATPIEDEAQPVIPIEQIKGPFVHRASMNGTPAEGPYQRALGFLVLDWTIVHLSLYRHLAPHELDHHALLKMAQDVRRDLAFPSGEVIETHPIHWGSRFDKDDARTMSHLARQLRFFEWEASQWALFQPYRQNHLEKGISREELCRAYYRWLVDAIERRDELVRSEPLRINLHFQGRLEVGLRVMYPEFVSDEREPFAAFPNERSPPPLDTTSQAPTHTPAQPPSSPALAPKAPAAGLDSWNHPLSLSAPQPPADAPQPPAARSTPDRGKNQNNVNSLHGAIALPEPEIQQPTRPAKRKRAPCALTRELRSLIQLGGPGNALVGRAVVIEPDNADEQEPQENGPDVAGWGRRLRRRLNGRVVSPES